MFLDCSAYFDESGCEADMAEGVEEGDSVERAGMLGTSMPPMPPAHSLAPTAATPLRRELECPQQQAINLKSEESDRDSSVGSPEPASAMGPLGGPTCMYGPPCSPLLPGDSAPTSDPHAKAAAVAAAHLNGTMAGMLNLQNLQNLASMQALPQMPSLAAGLQGLAGISGGAVNSPLNLSVGAQAPPNNTTGHLAPAMQGGPMPAAMPQLILASGQLVQGIQGAQLLIPTSQGIATQTILTIPVNHVNSSDQMVNLALSNGQVVTTSLANLQAMAQPHQLMNHSRSSPLQPPPIGSSLLNPSTLPHMLSTGAQQLFSSMQPQLSQNQLTQATPSVASSQTTHPTTSPHRNSVSMPSHRFSDKHMPSSNGHSNTALNNINRLAASNGEITITTAHAPAATSQSSVVSQQMKSSPTSLHLSPTGSDNSMDLLADSPNQPTINQTNCNMVDGINLDEIKEFAKAFKLRRLSLGLTQTQVGQALSVTEGPAYSQSAICSALAAQMYCAAQLTSQQQAMFEKLDITPKSAQKIKPVLERWMKEAEERYKSGQNHLTDFIGVEPSKKRKRRTSFTPQALELLNAHFERNTHPSGTEITGLAHQLGYEREVIRIWFCNKRQALKNTVRMMSKSMV